MSSKKKKKINLDIKKINKAINNIHFT